MLNIVLLFLALQGVSPESGTLTTAATSCQSTNSSCVVMQINASTTSVVIQMTGSFAGDVDFEGTADGSSWVPLSATRVGAMSALAQKPVNGAVTAGVFKADVAGLVAVRVRCDKIINGYPQVFMRASQSN